MILMGQHLNPEQQPLNKNNDAKSLLNQMIMNNLDYIFISGWIIVLLFNIENLVKFPILIHMIFIQSKQFKIHCLL
ncbi:hypothetical protein DERP_005266 [Dermatophagoides pteronyssinus]|uniref:Uncharacterized protein n=1 Tax=Dermatophagoides pteronyssinus TaxID=6956 RepID=A0ABQ8JMV9_DERPT|nr:hypothetical protein DERP_005266 [Dermatophagoides pteronyssinus]